MIDDPTEVTELLRKMEAQLPIAVSVTPQVAQALGGEVNAKQTVQITLLEYAGDEGGIVCGIDLPGAKEGVLISLTHLRIADHHPLAKAITAYQTRRVRRLDAERPPPAKLPKLSPSSPFALNLKASAPTFEEEYEDALNVLETGIVTAYREHPDMSDFYVLNALEAVINRYVAEQRQRPPRSFPLRGVDKVVYEGLVADCEMLLGRNSSETGIEALSLDVTIQCLKRIQKSVQRWNKQGGNQGYLRFVSQYIR